MIQYNRQGMPNTPKFTKIISRKSATEKSINSLIRLFLVVLVFVVIVMTLAN